MRLPDDELAALAADLESDRVERKESLSGDAPTKLREALCAFANDLPGHGPDRPGVALVGLRDDGTSASLSITDELLRTLADMRSDGNIQPLPTMTVEKRRLGEGEVAVVTVMPSDAPPVRYRGRVHIRTGPRRGIASAQDERILNERRRHRNRSFDLEPLPFASLSDLSRTTFENDYLPGAFAPDVLEANHRSYEERLSACRLVESSDSPVPTVLGALVVGMRPRDLVPCAYVQFLRVDGTELDAPIIDEAAVDGRLSEVIERTEEKLKAHISAAVDIRSSSKERRSFDYPLPALQQLVRNALMHRSYEATNAPVRVTWFSDRIEIINPGGPYGSVTQANFGRAGIADYRNPHVAEALKVLGYVQRFGVGIATARRLLSDNGNPLPEFDPSDTHVLVTVRKPT